LPASPNGWTIVGLFDTQESSREGMLAPAMAAGLDGGFTGPPTGKSFPVDAEIRG